MIVASVSIDRSDMPGSPAPLVIANNGTVYRLTEEGVGHVVQSVRVTTAPDSDDVDGSEIVSYSKAPTGLALEFHVFGSSSADLAAAVAELEDALYRLAYPVTRTVDGVTKTYSGSPCALVPTRVTVDSAVAAAHFETYGVTIPFPNPNGA